MQRIEITKNCPSIPQGAPWDFKGLPIECASLYISSTCEENLKTIEDISHKLATLNCQGTFEVSLNSIPIHFKVALHHCVNIGDVRRFMRPNPNILESIICRCK